MSDTSTRDTPTEIKLHQKARLLAIAFDDGKQFELPCEYLRVFSKAAEVRTMERPVTGKEEVNIERIEQQGQYALRLVFDDGHDTGIYSWDTLYELGQKREENWAAYLAKLQELGIERTESTGPRRIRVLYFAYLVQKLRKQSEELELPEKVQDVTGLLEFLRRRKGEAAPLFADDNLRVTVNRQFAEPFTPLADGDEVSLTPVTPVAPATPGLI